MSRRAEALLVLLTVLVDAIMAAVAFYLAYLVRAMVPIPVALRLGPFSNYLPQLVLQVVCVLAASFFYGLYGSRRGRSRIDLVYTLLAAVTVAALISTALSFLTIRDQALTRGMILWAWVLSILLVVVGRMVTGWLARLARQRMPDRLLLIGTGDVARMVLQKTVQSPSLGYKVVGFVSATDERSGAGRLTEIAGVPVLGEPADLATIVAEHSVDEVVIALSQATHDELLDMITSCEEAGAEVRIFPDLFQIVASDLRISDLDGLPLLAVRDAALSGWQMALKRGMDLLGSLVGLVLISPILMLVAVIIKLESKGPVFYAQTRVGLDGKPFPVLKFRSMRTDAEADTGPVWATEDDPRRTQVGRFLREKSIDELPQLINVLSGDMSLVGPRPERPVFVEQFRQVVPRYMDRLKVKAGLAGWAQVNGLRGNTSIVERTKYDVYYVENWSLLFDVKILIRTITNQFRKDHHAY